MISSCFDMDNMIEASDAIFVLICSHKVGSHVVWFPSQKGNGLGTRLECLDFSQNSSTFWCLVPRPSITLRGGRPGKTPMQNDVRYTLGIDVG